MQCELCGNECGSKGKPAIVDGVKMMLCPSCIKHGQGIKDSDTPPSINIQRSLLKRSRRIVEKDVYEKMDKELIANWHTVIKNARKQKGLTREELGFKIGERTVTIAKIEKGELRPSDEVAKKLEKQLSITLFEEVK
ncbi:MAG TPA: TIGR00270 family protein, partial [Candidatus Atribacteria bacterium]|nr:TIGR00270 family protein [Candidatus Atribacteria bacterium]